MGQLFRVLAIIFLVLSCVGSVEAQTDFVSILMFDKNAGEIHRLVDGNLVQLKIILPTPAESATQVAFFLQDTALPVASCALKSGDNGCITGFVSSLGWYWGDTSIGHPGQVIQAKLNGRSVPGVLEFVMTPRPVVMVHGFLSTWETWKSYLGHSGYMASVGLRGFAVGDGRAPGVLNTGGSVNPADHTNSIAQNADILKNYLNAVQQQTGAEKVDLVVHSMGGMISRYYLDRVMDNENIAQIIFLGTPMSGSACVYPLAALGFLTPASIEILPDYMNNIFNQQIVHRHGVHFYMLAGTLLIDPITSPCASAPSDTVVGLDSATSILLDEVQKLPLYHGDMTADKQVFDKYVLRWLQNPPKAFDPHLDPQSPAVMVQPGQFSQVYSGHIRQGESAEIGIDIDPNVSLASFSLYDSSRSLEIEVRGASGKVLTLDAAHNGLMKIDNPTTMLMLGYAFKQPKPGKWVVKLMSTASTPAQGADYAITARFNGGATLTASSSPTILAPGKAVDLIARLQVDGSNLNINMAEALIRKPDGKLIKQPLSIQGDGYSTRYLPDQPGLYTVELRLGGNNPSGLGINRAAFLAFEVQPGEADVQNSRQLALAAAGAVMILVIIMLVWLRMRKRRASIG